MTIRVQGRLAKARGLRVKPAMTVREVRACGVVKTLDIRGAYVYNVYMFEWDEEKNRLNIEKHGISFEVAKDAFGDPKRLILADKKHSLREKRFYCIGKVGSKIVTVRFVARDDKIRIIGAGVWRKERKIYEDRH